MGRSTGQETRKNVWQKRGFRVQRAGFLCEMHPKRAGQGKKGKSEEVCKKSVSCVWRV